MASSGLWRDNLDERLILFDARQWPVKPGDHLQVVEPTLVSRTTGGLLTAVLFGGVFFFDTFFAGAFCVAFATILLLTVFAVTVFFAATLLDGVFFADKLRAAPIRRTGAVNQKPRLIFRCRQPRGCRTTSAPRCSRLRVEIFRRLRSFTLSLGIRRACSYRGFLGLTRDSLESQHLRSPRERRQYHSQSGTWCDPWHPQSMPARDRGRSRWRLS